jgi:hypothetical protein
MRCVLILKAIFALCLGALAHDSTPPPALAEVTARGRTKLAGLAAVPECLGYLGCVLQLGISRLFWICASAPARPP